jgi:hypothetical protein
MATSWKVSPAVLKAKIRPFTTGITARDSRGIRLRPRKKAIIGFTPTARIEVSARGR